MVLQRHVGWRKEVPVVDSVPGLFSAARQLISKIDLDQGAADYLFKKSRWPGLSREQWESEVRLANSLHYVMRQSRSTLPWLQLVDPAAFDAAFARLRSLSSASCGTLLLTFQGPAVVAAEALYRARCAGRLVRESALDQDAAGRSDFSTDWSFVGQNTLRSGGVILMAPDAPRGNRSVEIKVLDATVTGGGGAAALAHGTQCDTAWYSLTRHGEHFIPAVEPGPTARSEETLAEFSDRLHAFYAKKIEEVFTGDPGNIKLAGRWAQAFALAGKSRLGINGELNQSRSASEAGDEGRVQLGGPVELLGASEQLDSRPKTAKEQPHPVWKGRHRPKVHGKTHAERARGRRRARALLPRADSVATLFTRAKKLALMQDIDSGAMEYLFARSSCFGLSREQWETEARLAGSIYQIMRRSRQLLPWEEVVNFAATEKAFAGLKSAANASKGTLLLTFHGAATPPTQELFWRCCEDGITLGGERINRHGVRSFDNSNDALFAALNALRDGGFVLMAPDGWKGQQTAQFNVLGVTMPGGGGAAFLAHAARCNTAWYTFVRDGDRFRPVIEAGPVRQDKESLAAFSERLHDFYAKKVEAIYSGDPRNIKLFGRWSHAFALAARSTEANPKGREVRNLLGGIIILMRSLLKKRADSTEVLAPRGTGAGKRPRSQQP